MRKGYVGFAQSERITQTIGMFYLSLCRLYLMPQVTYGIFMKLVWEINKESDEFSFRVPNAFLHAFWKK
jgi:hypothetical protein